MTSSQPAPTAPSPKPHRRTSLKTGAMLNWLGMGVYFLSAFILTRLILDKLGDAGFGTWALIQSFAGYYGLVNLGLGSALMRSITHDLAKKDFVSLQTTVSTAVRFFAITGGAILLLVALLGLPAAKFFNFTPAEAPWFALTALLAAGAIVLDFFGAISAAFISADERFAQLSALTIGRQIAQTLGTLAVLFLYPSVTGIAAVMLVTTLVSVVCSNRLAKQIAPGVSLFRRGYSGPRLRELLGYGGSTVMLTVSNIIRLRIGNIIIAKFAGVAAVAGYSIAVNLVTNLSSIISSSMGVLNPRFTKLDALSNTAELAKLYRSALFASSVMAFGIGTGLLIFGEKFIFLWVGREMPGAAPVLKLLVLAYIVALAQSPSWNLMFATAKHHFMARVTVVESALNLGLGFWLSRDHGAIGFAIATSGTMLVSKLLIHPTYGAKIGGISLGAYLAPMMFPAFGAVLLWAVSYWVGLDQLLKESGLLTFLVAGACYAVAFFGGTFLLARQRDYFPPFLLKFMPSFLRPKT